MRLQDCDLEFSKVGHGNLGINGNSGYDIIISVKGVSYENYISAHPESYLKYKIPKDAQYFSCQIGLNDSSEEFATADFEFIVDGKVKAYSHNVGKFCLVNVEFLLNNNTTLEINIKSTFKIICHSLILNPSFSNKPKFLLCPIHKSKISTENYKPTKNKVAVVSFIEDKFITYAKTLRETILQKTNKDINFVYMGESTEKIIEFCNNTNSSFIPIKCIKEENISNKDYLSIYHKPSTYSVAKLIDEEIIIILDVDMICASDISNLIERIENNSKESISVCKDSHTDGLSFGDLIISDWSAYKGSIKDKYLLSLTEKEINSSLIINSGVIAGNRKAILGVEDSFRRLLPQSAFYLNEKNDWPVREQALMNLSMIKYEDVEILHKKYNLQMLWEELDFSFDGNILRAQSEDFEPCFIHFNGAISKPYLNEFIDKFSKKENYKIDRIKCGSKVAELLEDLKMIKILDLQNYIGIVTSFMKSTKCKSYKIERLSDKQKTIINSFEDPFSKQIEDKMLELRQMRSKETEYDCVIVGNLDNPVNVSILLSNALSLKSKDGFIVFNESINHRDSLLSEILKRNNDFDSLRIKLQIEENQNQKVYILK